MLPGGLYCLWQRLTRFWGGRWTGSLNLSNVRLVPGATSAPSRGCLPADHSPIWTNLTTRRLLLALKIAACSVPGMLWTNNAHSPASKLRKRSSNRFLGTNPPRGRRKATLFESLCAQFLFDEMHWPWRTGTRHGKSERGNCSC